MNYLAFDCSSSVIYACVKKEDKFYDVSLNASGTENLMPIIDKVLKKAKLNINQIDAIGCGVGPGSWTGSRVACVSLYGLYSGMANKPKLFKFNSFEIAKNYNDFDCVVVPAFSDFIYYKQYNDVPKIDHKADFVNLNLKKVCSIEPVIVESKIVDVDLHSVIQNVISLGLYCKLSDIEPMYLRKSQAEIAMEEKMKNAKS